MGLGKWALEAATTTAILQMSKVFTKNSRNVCSFLFLPLFFLHFGNTLAVKFTHILQTVRHTLQSYGRLMKTHLAWHKKENGDSKAGKKKYNSNNKNNNKKETEGRRRRYFFFLFFPHPRVSFFPHLSLLLLFLSVSSISFGNPTLVHRCYLVMAH